MNGRLRRKIKKVRAGWYSFIIFFTTFVFTFTSFGFVYFSTFDRQSLKKGYSWALKMSETYAAPPVEAFSFHKRQVVEQLFVSGKRDLHFFEKDFNRTDALLDPQDRIMQDFKVPKSLTPRTAFWFDIYTKYGSHDHVIHHVDFPWIVYKVVNINDQLKSKRGNFWAKHRRAMAAVAAEKRKIRRALHRLSKKKSYRNLKGLEKRLFQKLKWVKGKRRHVFRTAARQLRSQLGQKDFFLSGLKNSNKYMAQMEKEFRQANLPIELTRLPFVESSFNEKAQSKVGASGIWQIMPRTGRSFGIVNKYIDERNNPFKATEAAAKILKQNKRSLKQWPLAVTAYNHGVGGVKKALRRSKSKNLPQLISRYHSRSFRFASKNFYTSFLAALHAERYHREIFAGQKIIKKPAIVKDVVQLNKRVRAKTIAKTAGIDLKTFTSYNLDLKNAIRRNAFIPKGFEIHFPRGKGQNFINKFAKAKLVSQNKGKKSRKL